MRVRSMISALALGAGRRLHDSGSGTLRSACAARSLRAYPSQTTPVARPERPGTLDRRAGAPSAAPPRRSRVDQGAWRSACAPLVGIERAEHVFRRQTLPLFVHRCAIRGTPDLPAGAAQPVLIVFCRRLLNFTANFLPSSHRSRLSRTMQPPVLTRAARGSLSGAQPPSSPRRASGLGSLPGRFHRGGQSSIETRSCGSRRAPGCARSPPSR